MSLYVVRTDTNDLYISLDDTVIDIANTMRLLGVGIDKDLNFNVHVKETIRKVSRKLQVLKRYKHLIPTRAKKTLYVAYFLPYLKGLSNTVFRWKSSFCYFWETFENSTMLDEGVKSRSLEKTRLQWKNTFSIRLLEKQVSWVALTTSNSDLRKLCGRELMHWYQGGCCWEFRPFLATTVCLQKRWRYLY